MSRYTDTELYRIFTTLFIPQAEHIIKYQTHGKNAIILFDEIGHVYVFKYFSPKNYLLQKGANKYEVDKSLKYNAS